MQRQENVTPLASTGRGPVNDLVPASDSPGASPTVVPFPRWQKACDRASAALLSGETLILVVGPPGTGKTLLLDHIARVLRASGWTVILRLADATLPPEQQGSVVLLIDEADRLSRAALDQLLATARCPVVLAGLDLLVSRVPGATQVALVALGGIEARDYVAKWLTLSGRSPRALDPAGMRRIVEISGGVPRLASTIMGAAAWLAESADETTITIDHIDEAAALRSCFVPEEPEPELEPEPAVEDVPERTNTPLLVALAAATLLLGAGAYVATRYYPAETERVASRARSLANGLAYRAQTALGDMLNGAKPTQVASAVAPPPEAPPERPVAPPSPAPRPAQLATTPPILPPPKAAPPAPAPTPVAALPASPESAAPRAEPVATPAKPASPPPPTPVDLPPKPAPSAPAPIEAAAPPPPVEPAPTPKPVVSAAKPGTPTPGPQKLPPETVELLVRRGNDMMGIGDISAARLLFIRAAEAGNADAMLAMGRTYDPAVLAQASPLMPADPAEAARWYRRAADAGNQTAKNLLTRVNQSAR